MMVEEGGEWRLRCREIIGTMNVKERRMRDVKMGRVMNGEGGNAYNGWRLLVDVAGICYCFPCVLLLLLLT